MTQVIDDYDAIAAVVQLYFDGMADGDRAKLEQAFHADARMFGAVGGNRVDIGMEAFFKMSVKSPMDKAGVYRARIVSVDQIGDVAVATVAEDGCWGQVSFVDYLSLARIGGVWKIVNKVFAHTGGEMPGRP
jgi:hypothetical protein